MSLTATLETLPKWAVLALALGFIGVLGFFDHVSGWDVSLFILYAVPILFCSWFAGPHAGFASASACGLAWYLANHTENPYNTHHAYVWASVNRLAYFVFVAVGGVALKRQREEMRARIEAMTRARELEQEILRISEREQMRIGQDLHDGLCQELVAIDCAAACLRSDLEARGLPEAAAASAIQKLLKAAAIEARNLARGIFPVQLDAEGLPAALEELVETHNRARKVPARLEIRGSVSIDNPTAAMHLFRIAQEALSNATRHAGAEHITITLSREGRRLGLIVADDGRGFHVDGTPSTGMGLRTMDYRARTIGAQLDIESQPGGGTLIRCSLPLSDASKN